MMYAFIVVINQQGAQNLFYSKFISCLYMFGAPCAHRQEVEIVLYSLWYHHTSNSRPSCNKTDRDGRTTRLRQVSNQKGLIQCVNKIRLV